MFAVKEVFATPAVSAIIERTMGGTTYILLQRRQKQTGDETHGLIEIVGGKIREYENIFDALRREVWEETGLRLTGIRGENEQREIHVNGTRAISFQPFCTVQNLSGIYSLIMHIFICSAEGEPLPATDETSDVHWERVETVKEMLEASPQTFFPMDIIPLKKYTEQL